MLILKNREIKMEESVDKAHIIKIASLTAIIGNLILAAAKIGTGFYSGSLAVVGDGIDSSVDVLIALMSLIVARIISRPADIDHPWGHGKAETVATAILSFVLFFAGTQLIIRSAADIISGAEQQVPSFPALVITLVSIAGKSLLAWSQRIFGKKAGSAILMANAKNMTADVMLSAGVLVGLGLSMILKIGIIDSCFAILVGIWVIKSAFGIFMEVNTELMDGGSNKKYYMKVFEAVNSIEEAGHPHRVRMRRIAGYWDIDIDIEVPPNKTVIEAHWISHKVENAIKEKIDNVYDIMVHIEPAGNIEEESFGLNEDTFKKR